MTDETPNDKRYESFGIKIESLYVERDDDRRLKAIVATSSHRGKTQTFRVSVSLRHSDERAALVGPLRELASSFERWNQSMAFAADFPKRKENEP